MAALDQKSLHDSYIAFKEILTHDVESKCLSECGESVLAMFNQTVHMLPNSNSKEHVDQRSLMDISDNADALHDIAQESLLLYPYKDVPFCWRLLVMDSGLLKASCLLKQLQGNTRLSHAQEIARDIIKVIDTAMIVSGAPGEQRRQVSHKTVDFLQEWLSATAGNQRLKQSIDESHSLTVQSSINISPDHYVHRLDDIPDFIWFVNHIQSPRPTPFIIPKGSIDHWPARSSRPWKSMAYLLSVAGDRIVPVEIGSKYTDADWQQKLMRFEDFVQNHVLQQTTNEPAYLAQHDLFYQIPRLADDIDVPDYCYASPPITDLYERSPPSDVIQNAWFGPSGTISPLHHDPYHNFLAQVVGSKYIRLYAPEQTDLLYPLDGIMSNTSQVDVENIDRERFPLAENASYIECVLKAGELLYIPPKWWHYVRSLETSFSVSFWF